MRRDHVKGSEEFGERRDIIGRGLRVITRGGGSGDRGITRGILGRKTKPFSEIQAVKVNYS